jgi:hypothetical protein
MALESAAKHSLFKLASFSVIYGLLPINWIDLFNPTAPGYHVWLVIMYMAPFAIVVLMDGLYQWPLALSLGLVASLMNDLFYYPVGNLFFGMHVDVVSWWQRQLGFDGFQHIFTFQGGIFSFDVTSMVMGASVYLRLLVALVLLYKWSHSSRGTDSLKL